jgi:hypothetical protein
MHSLGSISAIASEKKIFLYFPIWSCMGKMFQNASCLKLLGQLKPNCPGMILYKVSVFYADPKFKMAATTDHSINTGPYGKIQKYFLL